jgi:hypothetical protein
MTDAKVPTEPNVDSRSTSAEQRRNRRSRPIAAYGAGPRQPRPNSLRLQTTSMRQSRRPNHSGPRRPSVCRSTSSASTPGRKSSRLTASPRPRLAGCRVQWADRTLRKPCRLGDTADDRMGKPHGGAIPVRPRSRPRRIYPQGDEGGRAFGAQGFQRSFADLRIELIASARSRLSPTISRWRCNSERSSSCSGVTRPRSRFRPLSIAIFFGRLSFFSSPRSRLWMRRRA